jgi:hypothetical protein
MLSCKTLKLGSPKTSDTQKSPTQSAQTDGFKEDRPICGLIPICNTPTQHYEVNSV